MDGDMGDMGGFGDATSAPSNPGVTGVSGDIGDMPDSGTMGMNSNFADQNQSLADTSGFGFGLPGEFADNSGVIGNPADMSVDPTEQGLHNKGFLANLMNFVSKGLPPPMAAALGIGIHGFNGQTIGNITQGALAGMMGPIGIGLSALGNMTGQSLGNSIAAIPSMSNSDVSSANASTASPGNAAGGFMGNGGWGELAQGLAGMYMGNRSTGQYNDALGSLNNIFSPDSPYAQMMRQQMERKDAAGGRRSQYGPRETQLAALLAQHQASTLSSPGYANMMQQRNTSQNQGLNTLLSLLSKNSGRIGNGIQGMMQGGGLQSMFNNGYSDQWGMGANAGPQLPNMGGGGMFGGADPGGDGGYGDFFGG